MIRLPSSKIKDLYCQRIGLPPNLGQIESEELVELSLAVWLRDSAEFGGRSANSGEFDVLMEGHMSRKKPILSLQPVYRIFV